MIFKFVFFHPILSLDFIHSNKIMDYYVVDKCDVHVGNDRLTIYDDKNNIVGTKLNPTCSYIIDSLGCIDFSKKVTSQLYDHDLKICDDKIMDVFKHFYISDVTILPRIIGEIDILDEKYNHDNSLYKCEPHSQCCAPTNSYYPEIMFKFTIATCDSWTHNTQSFAINGEEFVKSFKPDNFKNEIKLHLTAHKEKNVTHKNDKITAHLKCTVDVKISGSSEIQIDGKQYLFDSNYISYIYCVYDSSYGENDIAWTFLCFAVLQQVNKPTVTKVTEKEFKSLDKHNADIVVYKDKTYLMKGTTNNNCVFDYSDCSFVRFVGDPGSYVSTCKDCNNCYNCRWCFNCNNCEECRRSIDCNDCYKAYDGRHDYVHSSSYRKITKYNIYDKYVSQYCNTEQKPKLEQEPKLENVNVRTQMLTSVKNMYNNFNETLTSLKPASVRIIIMAIVAVILNIIIYYLQ